MGVYVWAVGNKTWKLVEELDVKKSEKAVERIITGQHLRILHYPTPSAETEILNDAYAFGKAAGIQCHEFPTTAEAALEKA